MIDPWKRLTSCYFFPLLSVWPVLRIQMIQSWIAARQDLSPRMYIQSFNLPVPSILDAMELEVIRTRGRDPLPVMQRSFLSGMPSTRQSGMVPCPKPVPWLRHKKMHCFAGLVAAHPITNKVWSLKFEVWGLKLFRSMRTIELFLVSCFWFLVGKPMCTYDLREMQNKFNAARTIQIKLHR